MLTALKLMNGRIKAHMALVVALTLVASYLASVWPVLLADLYNGISNGSIASLEVAAPMLAVFGVVLAASSVIGEFRRVLAEFVSASFEAQTRETGFASALALPPAKISNRNTTELSAQINQGVEGCCQVLKLTCNDLLPAATTVIFVGFQVATGAPIEMLYIMAAYVAFSALVSVFQIRSQNGIRDSINLQHNELSGRMAESLSHHETITILAARAYEVRRLLGSILGLAKLEKYHHRVMGSFDALKKLVQNAFMVGILAVGVWFMMQGRMEGGTVVASAMLFSQLGAPLDTLYRLLDEFASSKLKIDRLADIMTAAEPDEPEAAPVRTFVDPLPANAQPEAPVLDADCAGAAQTAAAQTAAAAPSSAGNACAAQPETLTPHEAVRAIAMRYTASAPVIEVEDCIAFAPGGKVASTCSTFEVPTGSTVCLSGPNGCGKSSLMKAILKYFSYQGSIRLLGRSVKDYTRAELAQQTFYLAQTPSLHQGTIRDNLLMGFDESVSDEQLRRALDLALLSPTEFDETGTEDVLDHAVEASGSNLSGGQRQRVAAARVFLRRPTVLFLDEATASMDIPSTLKLMNNIKRHVDSYGGTIVLITHQEEVKDICDHAVCLGKLVESPTAASTTAPTAAPAASALGTVPAEPPAAAPAAIPTAAPAAVPAEPPAASDSGTEGKAA